MGNWIVKQPTFVSHIRVNRGLYYHHGLYLDDNTIINFKNNNPNLELDPSNAIVGISTLQEFKKDGIIEVREFDLEELKNKRSDNDIVNYAYTRLGEKGYDLINNNCEHFVNSCIFEKGYSDQVDKFKKVFEGFMNNVRN